MYLSYLVHAVTDNTFCIVYGTVTRYAKAFLYADEACGTNVINSQL